MESEDMTIHLHTLLRTIFTIVCLIYLIPEGHAHSGKARFHAIIDTDGAADDLRTLCMLLGNREVEVLAITTSEGALLPDSAAVRVRALLDSFYHEGVPVGAGRAVNAPAPVWRTHSLHVEWGAPSSGSAALPLAQTLIGETLENEEEKVFFIALGALTNLSDVLQANPALGGRIERVVWYNTRVEPLAGANYETDREAASRVLASGIPVTVVSANPDCPVVVTPALLDSVAAVPTVYARKIADTHRAAPLAKLVDAGHLQAWDDLAAVRLFAPGLFATRKINETVEVCSLSDQVAAAQIPEEILRILRGKPDSESRVFYGFPVQHELYAADVVPMVDETIARYGPSEWRAGVLTNELHGHLGIYATIGVKMGIRAREYFNIGVDDIEVTTYAGHNPPISCMNDGLQVGTGASVGHGLISVAENDPPRPEARFSFKGKTIRLALKPEYARRIRRDVEKGIELYGNLTEPYWLYVRGLALQYWLEFDRHGIFDMYVGE
ncbi:nucleoside hydrolase [uncultured Alistipes sp.]|jgi:inosine-uridine nucleoside N-ribohydrolase|uniref:nucleoside hydrolase n=1 Tax=uncultured Alistipes sp. TaxID=538949 RepID=UPI0025DFB29A|nr:nucleoside hydrolase [uncultured Alistipes sp.]